MEEKERKAEERNEQNKLTWEKPKFYALKKMKTEGGPEYTTNEDFSGS